MIHDRELDGPAGAAGPPGPDPARKFSFVRVLVLLVVVGPGLVVLLRPISSGTREAARRAQCTNNLKEIGIALHNYNLEYGRLPPAVVDGPDGRPWHSWRVLLLPYMYEQDDLYARYDLGEPWDGPSNRHLIDAMPRTFACPSDRASDDGGPLWSTGYLAVTGPGTAFPADRSVRLDEITDDPGETLLLVEVADAAIPWTAPVDLDADALVGQYAGPPGSVAHSAHPGGRNVCFADGSVHFLRTSEASMDRIRAMTTIAGGAPAVRPGRGTEARR